MVSLMGANVAIRLLPSVVADKYLFRLRFGCSLTICMFQDGTYSLDEGMQTVGWGMMEDGLSLFAAQRCLAFYGA